MYGNMEKNYLSKLREEIHAAEEQIQRKSSDLSQLEEGNSSMVANITQVMLGIKEVEALLVAQRQLRELRQGVEDVDKKQERALLMATELQNGQRSASGHLRHLLGQIEDPSTASFYESLLGEKPDNQQSTQAKDLIADTQSLVRRLQSLNASQFGEEQPEAPGRSDTAAPVQADTANRAEGLQVPPGKTLLIVQGGNIIDELFTIPNQQPSTLLDDILVLI